MNRTSDLRVLILNLWSSTEKNSSFDPDDDFGLGFRNVSHFYRQQSFSGLPTPRWLKTARSNVTSGFKPFTIQTTILANIISKQQQLNKKNNNNKQTYGQGKELIKHRNSDWKLHYYRNDIFHRSSTSLLHFLMYFWRFCSFEPSLYLVLLKGSSFTSLQILLDWLMVRWEMVKKL